MQLIHDLPADQYHAAPGLNASLLKAVAKKPLAKVLWDLEHREHKPAFDIGTAAHSLILEGRADEVTIIDATDWRTKTAREARDAAHADGKVPLLGADWEHVAGMSVSIRDHPDAGPLLTGHTPEVTAYGQMYGDYLCKARFDAWRPDDGLIVDLKTTASADPAEFTRTALHWGYHQQAAHYVDLAQAITGFAPRFLFVLVEKTAPYLVSVVELDDDYLSLGREQNTRAVETWANRPDQPINGWPATTLTLPAWARKDT